MENNFLSYIVYQTEGAQDKIGQNLDLDFFEIALRWKIVKAGLHGKPLN